MFLRDYAAILEPSLPVFTSAAAPPDLGTKRQWKKRRRKVKKHQEPVARLQWTEPDFRLSERHETDGSITTWKEKVQVQRECGLYSEDQTDAYRGTSRRGQSISSPNTSCGFQAKSITFGGVTSPSIAGDLGGAVARAVYAKTN
jgi:hypothetical protein